MTVEIATPIAVSVLVGGPFILICVCIVACYLRRKRLQTAEDEQDKDLEAGLNEDLLFVRFSEELHLRMEKKVLEEELTDKSLTSTIAPPDTAPIGTPSTETPSTETLPISTPVTSPSKGNKMQNPRNYHKSFIRPSDSMVLVTPNSKITSASEFYDTMIPIMTLEESNSLSKPPSVHGDTTLSSSNSVRSFGRRSVDTTALNKTLEALAMLLHSPQFTKKLHLATYTHATPPRSRDSSYPSLPELTRPLALRADIPSSLTSLSESIMEPTLEVILIPEELIEPPKALVRECHTGATVVV